MQIGTGNLADQSPFANVLVSGANGFVGRVLIAALTQQGFATFFATREATGRNQENERVIGAISGSTNWSGALKDIDVVIHLAARVHVMHERASDPLAEFRKVNVAGTEQLARSAAAAGVKRLVYVSSIKVNGEETKCDSRFAESDTPAPLDPYGISKCEAEQVLQRVAVETGLEVVIVRPPLVYGAGVKGNFRQMLKAISWRVPLPFLSISNRRSLVYVGNLADALIVCAIHPSAAGQTYLISDGEDISTPDLLRRLGLGMGHPARLFSFPVWGLSWGAKLAGKAEQAQRLLGSLQIDSGKIRRELNWTPPYSLQQGLQATAEWYRKTHP